MAAEDKTLRLRFEVTGNGTVKVKELDGKVKELNLTMKQATVVARQYGTTVDNLAGKTFKATSPQFQKMAGQMGDLSSKTGAASSAALELGRVVSDMPYGIRGVANNLSQFASMMMFSANSIDRTTKKALGFTGAVRGLISSLKGPLGVLLAINAVIAAFDYFAGASSMAKKEVDDLNKSIDEQTSKFNMLTEFLNNSDTKSIDDVLGTSGFNESLKVINNEFGEFKKKYESLSDSEKKDEKTVTGLINKYKQLLKVRGDITSDTRELRELEEDGEEVGRIENLKGIIALNYRLKASLESLFTVEKKQKQTKKAKEDKILPIEDPLFGQDIDDLIEGYDKSINLNLEYQRKLNQSRALLSDEQKIIQSEKNRELLEEEIAHNEKMLLADMANGEGSMKVIERKNTINNLMIDLRNSDLDHELMIIEQKKNAQMEYANYVASIGNILSKISGKNKDLALAALLVQKGAAIAGVVIKNNEANAAIMLKAKSDASQAISGGNLDIAKSASAFASGNPAQGTLLAASGSKSIAAGGSILAQGAAAKTKNNISAGLSIASILATTLSSRSLGGGGSSGNAGGGVSGGGGSREFDFNLVGSTGVNQLAQGIGGQFDQPIQAYVVSSQMTSQQQLDNVIQSSATIGD